MWRVLIAEDNLENCQQMVAALGGYAECDVVHSGEAAVEAYEVAIKNKYIYDFILLDVMMPGVSGFDVLKHIRAQEEGRPDSFRETVIIMITTYKDSLMDKYNMGWDDFITKPIDSDKLVSHMVSVAQKAAG